MKTCIRNFCIVVVLDSQSKSRNRKYDTSRRVLKTADLSELKRLFSRTDQSSENIRASTFLQRKEILQSTKEAVDITEYCSVIGLSFNDALHVGCLTNTFQY